MCNLGFPGGSAGKETACNTGDPGFIPGSGRSPGERTGYPLQYSWASLVAQMVKNLPAMRETWVWSLGREDPLEEGMATHSSILAWRIPWREGPGGCSPWGHKESDTTERLRTHTRWVSYGQSMQHPKWCPFPCKQHPIERLTPPHTLSHLSPLTSKTNCSAGFYVARHPGEMGSGGVGQGDSGQKSRWSEMRVGLRKRLAELGALGSKQFSARCDFRHGPEAS